MNGLNRKKNGKVMFVVICALLRTTLQSFHYILFIHETKKEKGKNENQNAEKERRCCVNRIIIGVSSEKCNFDTCLLGVECDCLQQNRLMIAQPTH